MSYIQKVATTTETTNIKGVLLNFNQYNAEWIKITNKFHHPPMHSCFMCEKRFKTLENITLAITDKGNKGLCENCGKLANDELHKEG